MRPVPRLPDPPPCPALNRAAENASYNYPTSNGPRFTCVSGSASSITPSSKMAGRLGACTRTATPDPSCGGSGRLPSSCAVVPVSRRMAERVRKSDARRAGQIRLASLDRKLNANSSPPCGASESIAARTNCLSDGAAEVEHTAHDHRSDLHFGRAVIRPWSGWGDV
jgi:hypothetical protein